MVLAWLELVGQWAVRASCDPALPANSSAGARDIAVTATRRDGVTDRQPAVVCLLRDRVCGFGISQTNRAEAEGGRRRQ